MQCPCPGMALKTTTLVRSTSQLASRPATSWTFHTKPSLATRSFVILGCSWPVSSLLLFARWLLTQVPSFGSVGQPFGTRQCPCPGMALKVTSSASIKSQTASQCELPPRGGLHCRACLAWRLLFLSLLVDPPGQLRVGRPVKMHRAVAAPRHGLEHQRALMQVLPRSSADWWLTDQALWTPLAVSSAVSAPLAMFWARQVLASLSARWLSTSGFVSGAGGRRGSAETLSAAESPNPARKPEDYLPSGPEAGQCAI